MAKAASRKAKVQPEEQPLEGEVKIGTMSYTDYLLLWRLVPRWRSLRLGKHPPLPDIPTTPVSMRPVFVSKAEHAERLAAGHPIL